MNVVQNRQTPQKRIVPYDDYFIYTCTVGALAAASSTNFNLQLDSDADFQWLSSSYRVDGPTDATIASVFSQLQVNIKDTASGRYLMSDPVYCDLICGIFGEPFVNTTGHIFAANSVIELTFTNPSTLNALANIVFSLIGVKRFFYNAG